MAAETFEFDGEEFDLEIDNTTAEIPKDYYLVEVTKNRVKRQPNKDGNTYTGCAVTLKIVDGPFEGNIASMNLQLDNKKVFPSKIRRAFFNAITNGEADGQLAIKIVRDLEGNPMVEGIDGSQLVAQLETNEQGFLNVVLDNMLPADEYNPSDDEDPFE
jgi:hypothetical protein